jgi:glycerol-3-phosphate dehydrogenase (NAD(P)+)
MNITVIGAGGWGTTLALLALENQHQTTLWVRRPDQAERLSSARENHDYLPGVPLPAALTISSDLAVANSADLLLLVVPSAGALAVASQLPRDIPLVSCVKGVAADGRRLSEVLLEMGFAHLAVLSGPNLAPEIAAGGLALSVVASSERAVSKQVQRALNSQRFRVYRSDDVVGVELGGVLKNVIAVAAGLCDGLALGDNAKAALMTRGLREIARFAVAQGAEIETLYGLAGLGDLIATCASPLSRNRTAGERLARGESTEQGGKVVEGILTASRLSNWSKLHGIEMPLSQTIHQIASGFTTPQAGLAQLMRREVGAE